MRFVTCFAQGLLFAAALGLLVVLPLVLCLFHAEPAMRWPETGVAYADPGGRWRALGEAQGATLLVNETTGAVACTSTHYAWGARLAGNDWRCDLPTEKP
jgi:hypothetical protein